MIEYSYDKLIIGGDLESLLTAYNNALPILILKPELPQENQKYNNVSRRTIWHKLSFLLAYCNLNNFNNSFVSYRFNDDNSISVFMKNHTQVLIKARELIRFDKNKIEDYDELNVYDHFELKNLPESVRNFELNTPDRFVSKIIGTKLNDRSRKLIVESKLWQEQLNDELYSEIYVRLKTKELLKQNGYRGRWLKSEKTDFLLEVELSHDKREVFPDTSEKEDKLISETNITNEFLIRATNLFGSPYDD